MITAAQKVHGNKYDYSLIDVYQNDKVKYPIICHEIDEDLMEHGIFYQTMNNHIQNRQGCPKCGKINSAKHRKISVEEIINRAKEAHPLENYIYHEETYNGVENKMKITCPVHGIFTQKVANHIKLKQGCPECKKSALEREIEILLVNNNIRYIYEYRTQWLGLQSLDYFLPDYNIAIECQGIQHFHPTNFNGKNDKKTIENLEKVVKLDNIKKEKCQRNNIKLLYYANYEYNFPYEIITSKDKLLKQILSSND